VKNAEALELLEMADTLVVDKGGEPARRGAPHSSRTEFTCSMAVLAAFAVVIIELGTNVFAAELRRPVRVRLVIGISPGKNQPQLLSLNGSRLITGHRRPGALRPEHRTDALRRLVSVMSPERIIIHVEMAQGMVVGAAPGVRVALSAARIKHRLCAFVGASLRCTNVIPIRRPCQVQVAAPFNGARGPRRLHLLIATGCATCSGCDDDHSTKRTHHICKIICFSR
jgi:hypothetical protein